eukprot:gene12393-6060_t
MKNIKSEILKKIEEDYVSTDWDGNIHSYCADILMSKSADELFTGFMEKWKMEL